MKQIVHLTILFAAMSFPGTVVADDQPSAVMPQEHAAFFRENCLKCHNAKTQEGKVNLQTLSFNLNTLETAELWQKVLNAINSGEMPPEGQKQPTAEIG